ncbi:MAG: hypothetical protein PF541_06170 [Prolixibacteraceae bacterium]|jgi:tetratricopeptide (TPR) repeat protein|nr:hypothetical protein [Prolixibacteraceae bacterium]
MHRKLIIIIFFLFPTVIFAQSAKELNQNFTKFLLEGNEKAWEKQVYKLQSKQLSQKESEILLSAEYGLIGFYMANNQLSDAEKMIGHFENHLSSISKTNIIDATNLAYEASIAGFKIAISPGKAIFLAGVNKRKIEKALSIDPDNPIALFEQANSLFFRPENFGGNQKNALTIYEKAFSIMEKEIPSHWIYYNTGVWLGQVYTHFNQLKKARHIYEQLLDKAPNYKIVAEVLYPNIKLSEFDEKWDAFLEDTDED